MLRQRVVHAPIIPAPPLRIGCKSAHCLGSSASTKTWRRADHPTTLCGFDHTITSTSRVALARLWRTAVVDVPSCPGLHAIGLRILSRFQGLGRPEKFQALTNAGSVQCLVVCSLGQEPFTPWRVGRSENSPIHEQYCLLVFVAVGLTLRRIRISFKVCGGKPRLPLCGAYSTRSTVSGVFLPSSNSDRVMLGCRSSPVAVKRMSFPVMPFRPTLRMKGR